MINLGYKSNYPEGMLNAPVGPKEKNKDKTCYPQVSIRGDGAKKLVKGSVDAGDTITAMVTFRVVEVEQRVKRSHPDPYMAGEEGTSVDLELVSMDDLKIKGEEPKSEDPEEGPGEAVDNYVKEKGLSKKKG